MSNYGTSGGRIIRTQCHREKRASLIYWCSACETQFGTCQKYGEGSHHEKSRSDWEKHMDQCNVGRTTNYGLKAPIKKTQCHCGALSQRIYWCHCGAQYGSCEEKGSHQEKSEGDWEKHIQYCDKWEGG